MDMVIFPNYNLLQFLHAKLYLNISCLQEVAGVMGVDTDWGTVGGVDPGGATMVIMGVVGVGHIMAGAVMVASAATGGDGRFRSS